VGMLIDPEAIKEHHVAVICVTLLTLFGKFFSTTFGALLSGQPLKQSIQVGMSMAQIGEFAFIVATLGLSLGVTSDFLFPVAVGASAITTFTTPYLIKISEPFYLFISKLLPPKWEDQINSYSYGSQNIQTESNWKQHLKSYAQIVLINAVILLGMLLVSINFLKPFLDENIQNETLSSIISVIVSIGIASPFIWGLIRKRPTSLIQLEIASNQIIYSKGPLLVFEIIRVIIGILFIGYWIYMLLLSSNAAFIALVITIALFILVKNRLQKLYFLVEERFLKNLYARENAVVIEKEPIPLPNIVPWDAHLIDLEVNPQAEYIGRNLSELGWREKYGINIAYIKRGDKLIYAPGRNNKLLPFDHIGILSTDEQIKVFKPQFDKVEEVESEKNNVEDITLQPIVVDEYNKLDGLSIRNSGIREHTNGLIVGIERKGQRILNPDSTTVLEKDDILWLVGDRREIQKLKDINK
jgi:CPA2 family monovalent cation:H+ antiporter-2